MFSRTIFTVFILALCSNGYAGFNCAMLFTLEDVKSHCVVPPGAKYKKTMMEGGGSGTECNRKVTKGYSSGLAFNLSHGNGAGATWNLAGAKKKDGFKVLSGLGDNAYTYDQTKQYVGTTQVVSVMKGGVNIELRQAFGKRDQPMCTSVQMQALAKKILSRL